MKVALVHDWFNKRVGGAEQVTFELAKMFPKAPIYTLLFNKKRFGRLIDEGRVHTTFLQRLPAAFKLRPRYLLPLIPKAVGRIDVSGFDIVFSVSSAFVKNTSRRPGSIHICYCNSPMRFAWDYEQQYLAEQNLGPLRQHVAAGLTRQLKQWDLAGNRNVDVWLANSQTVAERIKRFYNQPAQVVYPPVDTKQFKPRAKKQDYYLTLAGLTPYKKIDLAIEACNLSGRRLYVVGEGSDRARLEQLAGPTIRFTGYVSQAKKRRLLENARGLIFPSVEDFGIAPVEAMAAGTPVIAFGQGGLTETVIDGKTGLLFNKQTREGLTQALDEFETRQFDPKVLAQQAAKFDSAVFRRQIKAIINKASQHVQAR